MSFLDIEDLKKLEKGLQQLPAELTTALYNINKDRFKKLRDVNDVPYKANAPSWIKVKGNRTPTIGLTGNLRDDLKVTNQQDVIRMVSNMDYASFVQKEREFLGVSIKDLDLIVAQIESKLI